MEIAQLVAIPLPAADQSTISIFYSPRLRTQGPLAAYPDWRDWPAALAGLTVSFELENDLGATVSVPAGTPTTTPSSTVWKALFGDPAAIPTPELPVFFYQFTDRSQQSIRTWRASGAAATLDNFYRTAADAFPINIPGASDIPNGLLNSLTAAGQEFRAYIASMRPDPSQVPAAPAALARYGFHEIVGAVQSHPHLLRLLGLVTDHSATIPTSIGTGPFAGPPTKIRVITNYDNVGREQISVAVQLANGLPASDPTGPFPIDGDGWLDATGWELTGLDHRAGLHQMIGWQKSLQEDENPIPVPPANGISILLNDSETQARARLQALMDRHRATEQAILDRSVNGEPVLYRDDLTVGFRFDVEDLSKPNSGFLSLFERRPIPHAQTASEYRFPDTTSVVTGVPDDEGWMVPTVTSEDAETATRPPNNLNDLETVFFRPQAEIRFSPQLFKWDGWSGAAPRPGNVMDNDGNVTPPDQNEPGSIPDIVQVGVNYRPVPQSLPQLRYGHTYRFRARAVDLAGNSQDLSAKEPASARSASITFGRTDAVPAPIPARDKAAPVPGVRESLDTIVLLSELGDSDNDVEEQQRVFFPPPAIQLTLERHGLPGDGDDASAYSMLASRDAVTVDDHTFPDPVRDERISNNGDLQPVVGYLPDPAGTGISFAGLPGATQPVVVPVTGTWPDFSAFSLRVISGTSVPKINPSSNISVQVEVPKSVIADVDVSMAIGDPDDFFLNQNASTPLSAAIGAGRHWMTSGRLPIRLVHATRLPLELPVPSNLSATRPLLTDDQGQPLSPGLGSLEAHITLDIGAHSQSTSRLRCLARWTDPIDEGPGGPPPATTNVEGDPGTRTRSGEFGSLAIGYDDADQSVTGTDMVLQMRDSKAHDVCVTVQGFSRFSEFFTERTTVDFGNAGSPTAITSSSLPASGTVQEGIAAGSLVVRLSDGTVVDRGDYEIDRDASTVTPVAGGALVNADDATVDFVPLPVSRLSTGRTPGDPGNPTIEAAKVVVPASRRPKLPEVFQIIPSVARDVRTASDGTIRIRHNGQVLRFFLERPWWTSGRDERLGIVLDGDLTNTVLGRDPVFGPSADNDLLAPPTDLEDWRRAVNTGNFDGLDVAGHEVTWDPVSERWIADVELAADVGYRPFIRPVICRLQPDAIANAYLSERVLADPHRLGVQREVQVRPGQSSVAVTVTGPDNLGVIHEGTNYLNEIEAYLQVPEAGVSDPELRWMDLPGSQVQLRRNDRGDGWTNWTGKLDLTAAGPDVRLVLEEREPGVSESSPGLDTITYTTVYVETVDLATGVPA